MNIPERLSALREQMRQRGISMYIVPTADFHESEYVGDYFKARQYITGFTGSAGTAVIEPDRAGLWTDGRYHVQAENQLQGSGVTLFKAGNDGVPTVFDYVKEHFQPGMVLGFDGRVMNAEQAGKYQKLAEEKGGKLQTSEDLIGEIWKDRPALPAGKVWVLPDSYAGESTSLKLSRIREAMREKGANAHLVSSLYDIAWILNIRGNDIAHVPVVLSFLLISEKEAVLFINPHTLTDKVRKHLEANHIFIAPYFSIYETLEKLPSDTVLLADRRIISYQMEHVLQEGVRIEDASDPSVKMKAVKNQTEIENTKAAHIRDGVAVTRFMYWLKTNVGKIPMDEYSVGEYLNHQRARGEHFLDLSFDNICAYGANAAMMHYQAHKDAKAQVKPEGMLLVDSGGHYLEGTTDITRTFILGPVSKEEKENFTRVAAANLRLADAKFLYGCTGQNLDILARGGLWKLGLDYKCGTGHGVGHILNVHEGPNAFRWKIPAERADEGVLEAGMITTDEPGVYIDGKYGIRTENELLCVKEEKNGYGQFMGFEMLTWCPIDLDGIEKEILTEEDIALLNAYHKKVYEKLSPYFEGNALRWLQNYTRAI